MCNPDRLSGLLPLLLLLYGLEPPDLSLPSVDVVFLKNIDVDAAILGRVAEVQVTQVFQNTLDEPINAVYIFPLPEDAAVHEMVMHFGERTIRAEIEEREAAEARSPRPTPPQRWHPTHR